MRFVKILAVALILATIGQWGLKHNDLFGVGWFIVWRLPGFYFSMFVGLEGLLGHSPAAPYVKFFFNTVFYCALFRLVTTVIQRIKKHAQQQERLYDHR